MSPADRETTSCVDLGHGHVHLRTNQSKWVHPHEDLHRQLSPLVGVAKLGAPGKLALAGAAVSGDAAGERIPECPLGDTHAVTASRRVPNRGPA